MKNIGSVQFEPLKDLCPSTVFVLKYSTKSKSWDSIVGYDKVRLMAHWLGIESVHQRYI